MSKIQYEYQGKKYNSIQELEKDYSINRATLKDMFHLNRHPGKELQSNKHLNEKSLYVDFKTEHTSIFKKIFPLSLLNIL